MDTRPIGVFDSGVGGLTVVRALEAILPEESILYYGDTAHLPYGDKSADVLRGYVTNITRFLLEQDVKAIVIACNTASAVGYETVLALSGKTPVYEVIGPAVQEACRLSVNGHIGVIGTKTTILSHVYLRRIHELRATAHVIEKATPLLVPIIEDGWLNNPICDAVLEAYLSDTGFNTIDTLILGCTHYPLVATAIEQYFKKNGHSVRVIDSSLSTAKALAIALEAAGLRAPGGSKSIRRYYVSDLTPGFEQTAHLLFGSKIDLTKISLSGILS